MYNTEKIRKLNIPKSPGCYRFYDKDGKLLYIGKAADLRGRVASYWRAGANHNPAKQAMLKEVTAVEWTEAESEIEALLLEANLIKKYQPPYNVLLRDDKRFQYIVVTTGDEVPGVFTARTIGQSGRYFGPYTGGLAVKETLKAIRKIWPYCTARKIGPKPCFYAQIGRCLGPCGGLITVKEYNERVIKPIILFLAGKKNKIIKDMEKKIKSVETHNHASAAVETHDYASLINETKYRLMNMRNVLEHARVLSIGDKYAADVVELAKVLGLPRVPERIEGYDIADIFGREAVGSMAVFSNGEPDKSEYRKFKIKTGQGKANDARMLKEILERRFKHTASGTLESPHPPAPSPSPERGRRPASRRVAGAGDKTWPFPDLIIIDGGKAQLNAALSVIKKNRLEIPVLAVSKGEGRRGARAPDKIFFPGESKPLILPLASPALHIVKRVRDEAHRFAAGYHKLLRKKNLLNA